MSIRYTQDEWLQRILAYCKSEGFELGNVEGIKLGSDIKIPVKCIEHNTEEYLEIKTSHLLNKVTPCKTCSTRIRSGFVKSDEVIISSFPRYNEQSHLQ